MPANADLRRWAIPGLVAACVVLFAAGSSSSDAAKSFGGHARWVALVVLLVAAVYDGWRKLDGAVARRLLRIATLPVAFVWLAVVSSAWSFEPGSSFAHAASVGLLFATAAGVAVPTSGDPLARRRVLLAPAAATTLIATVGLLMLIVGNDDAAQPASPVTPWRYRGFGENPNTVALIIAVVLPLVAWLVATTSGIARRLWLGAALLLLVSVVMSESRGALVAAFAGTAATISLLALPRTRRLVAIAALAAIFVSGLVLREAAQPAPPPFQSAVQTVAPAKIPPPAPEGGKKQSSGGNVDGLDGTGAPPAPAVKPTELPARSDEDGHPTVTAAQVTPVASGRLAAWRGALSLVEQRPLLGYGFGTESRVFVDHFYSFQGDRPENSALGLLLQLGAVGLVLLLLIAGDFLWRGARAARRAAEPGVRATAAAGVGVVVAAMIVAMIQSYIYAAGNIAVLTVWLAVFVVGIELGSERAARR